MNKRIDRFLLGLLWLLAMTLGANFWFTTRFGFNIFLVSHWKYLGEIQAAGSEIEPLFYISLVVFAFLTVFGLFMLVRTKLRKITFDTGKESSLEKTVVVETPVIKMSEIVIPEKKENVLSPVRPPRLSIPVTPNYSVPKNQNNLRPDVPVNNIPEIPTQVKNKTVSGIETSEIEEIFKQSGYLVKKPSRIAGFLPDLFAIGADEVLWVGGIGSNPNEMSNALEKLKAIFKDTLEDIDINVKSFIISDDNASTDDFASIEKFASVQELRDYMGKNKSREIQNSEQEDFEAYSEYIDTVADYFNKL
ncbi:MAG TPA: hypothetical protein PKJ33_00805 [Alphaproteobacteria bacterium]|nr:hypothetical protein [Alphaproteobacteria bacterium]